jgi:hypothetical protein
MLFEKDTPLPGYSKVNTAVTIPCQLLSVFIFLKYEDFLEMALTFLYCKTLLSPDEHCCCTTSILQAPNT